MSPDLPTVDAESTLLAATQRLHGAGMPALPVVDADRRALGVLTAWDVVRAIAMGHDLNSTRAANVTGDDLAVAPDRDLELAARRGGPMLPVVEDGVYIGALTRPDVAAARRLDELLGEAAATIEHAIAPNDTMYAGVRGSYLMAGIVALEWIRKGMEDAGITTIGTLVDLPCGHGRVMRVLRAAYPQARLVACDVDRDGVDFCVRTFGAEPVYSERDPAKVQIRAEADVVWVGSLLTHVPPARWPAFLDLFERALRPGGVLVVTTFDRPPLVFLSSLGVDDPDRMLREREQAGSSFRPYAGEPEYGLTLADPDWVRDGIAKTSCEVLHHEPRGWFPPGPAQDVWICRRAAR